jgi:hypothetical protein
MLRTAVSIFSAVSLALILSYPFRSLSILLIRLHPPVYLSSLSRSMLNADIPAPADAAPSTAKARYVVETLLIPTQHAPRNTCTADEENEMLRLTEERGFITLGWVSGASLPFSFPFRP